MNTFKTLEFDTIRAQLSEHAVSDNVKTRCLMVQPSLSEAEVKRWQNETTQARRIIESAGTPPLPTMENLQKTLALVEADAMLVPEQLLHVTAFLAACRRMKQYLKKAETTGDEVAFYGGSLGELPALSEEIERCIINGSVDSRASAELHGIRRQMDNTRDQIKEKLDGLLRKNKGWFSESFVSVRNNRFTLLVKREYKSSVPGTLVEMSHTGGTCFIEPASVGKLTGVLATLEVEEDCEVRRILYTLTAMISEELTHFKLNIELLETLDFLFAKGKLSIAMDASPATVTTDRTIRIIAARHPLIDPAVAVPLDFEIGGAVTGVVITGPNTGGKTVALKTVGLLSLMVQSGLHVPANEMSTFSMHHQVLCDIGDGQSIQENLSTFSAHMKNIIDILQKTDHESLVLLDELGSGTDPAEGMGLAVAIVDTLCGKGCLFVVTTHYPEVKDYAAKKPGIINARMAFDKESLKPLYKLELGEAGESCALSIARRLGMPEAILSRAHEASYGARSQRGSIEPSPMPTPLDTGVTSKIIRETVKKPMEVPRCETFNIGDSVIVYPQKEIGLVYQQANSVGELGVQIKGIKKLVNHKRVKLHVPASELYPEDYDFSIVFDTVENRKARHLMEKRHEPGNVIVIKEGDS